MCTKFSQLLERVDVFHIMTIMLCIKSLQLVPSGQQLWPPPPASVPCGDVTVEPCMWIMPQRGVPLEQCIDKIIFVGTIQLN